MSDPGEDFVFNTLIANHQDPALASRALSMAEASALHNAADTVRTVRDARRAEGPAFWSGMTRAIEVLRLLADQANAPEEAGR